MHYRKLGSSDILVSEISLGSWMTFGTGLDKARSTTCIRAALGAGITTFDTANVYGHGAAEAILGEALSGLPRQSYVLATKLFFPMSATDSGLSRGQIKKQLDASLMRLRTDYVDLYQCHRYDTRTPLEETMQALTEVVQQGKVRAIGFSEWPSYAIRVAFRLGGVERFVSSQPQYSMFHRSPERWLIPFCRTHGISQIVWSPLAQGLLTGKYTSATVIPADSRAASDCMGAFFPLDWFSSAILDPLQELSKLAAELGITMPRLPWRGCSVSQMSRRLS